jgi:hypothetical protein
MSITVLNTPELKIFNAKAADHLARKVQCDGLFLPFPRESTEFVVRLCEGLPPNLVVPDLKKALEPILSPTVNQWENSVEPLLKALPQIKKENPKMQPYCYRDSFFTRFETGNTGELAVLALKAMMSGQIDAKEWRAIIKKDQKYRYDSLETEIDFISHHAENHERNSCISSVGSYFAIRFQQEGFETALISFGRYSPIPIEQLFNGIFQESISDEEIKRLVLLHLEYIKKCIYKSTDIEEANYRWQIRKNPLKRLIFEMKKLGQKK